MRKRNYNIFSSDSENDDDVPISKLIKSSQDRVNLNRCSEAATSSVEDKVTGTTAPRQRLLSLRECVSKGQENKKKYNSRPHKGKSEESIPTNEDTDDNESEEVLSDSEDESLNDFIVDDSYVSDCEDASKRKVIKWSGNLLAASGKDACLCMRAVCALYRQQTSDERTSKGNFYRNQRGFSTIHAIRGSELAEFLTDRDPYSGLKLSVEELQRNCAEHWRFNTRSNSLRSTRAKRILTFLDFDYIYVPVYNLQEKLIK
ncbi:hypothetical protein L6164_030366 [Bauhinia variegata]|uniref:Uncharacterized protein n=1 Tax=Bauhinia variegata TaxID=167791 RepID=A0ACB9LC20_BAUVA|nr:hypothetical protein L6164_030366 [Bauhinia variegata]